jgi:hypothetical protein
VFVTLISAYVVAIWAFLRHAGLGLRIFSFFFLTLVTGFLGRFLYVSQFIHDGMIETLAEIDRTTGLSPAGAAALANATSGLDTVIQQSMGFALVITYLALFFLTFFARSTLKAKT